MKKKIEHLRKMGMPENLIEQQVSQWEESERIRPQREAERARLIELARSRITGQKVEVVEEDAVGFSVKIDTDLDERGQGSGDAFLVIRPTLDGELTAAEAIRSVRGRLAEEFGFSEPGELGGAAEEGDELARLVFEVEGSELANRFVRASVRFSDAKVAEIEAEYGYPVNWEYSQRVVTLWREHA